jgi:hypothetical protein
MSLRKRFQPSFSSKKESFNMKLIMRLLKDSKSSQYLPRISFKYTSIFCRMRRKSCCWTSQILKTWFQNLGFVSFGRFIIWTECWLNKVKLPANSWIPAMFSLLHRRKKQPTRKKKEKKGRILKCWFSKQGECTNGYFKIFKTLTLLKNKNKSWALIQKYRYPRLIIGS